MTESECSLFSPEYIKTNLWLLTPHYCLSSYRSQRERAPARGQGGARRGARGEGVPWVGLGLGVRMLAYSYRQERVGVSSVQV